MEKALPLLLDLAAVLFVAASVRAAARRGFVRTVVQLVGFFVSMFLANLIAGPAAEYAFGRFIRQPLLEKVTEQLSQTGSADAFLQSLAAVLESIPAYLKNAMEFAGLPADWTIPSASGGIEQVAGQIVDETIAPTCIALITTIFFLLLFSLFMFLTRMAARCFTGLRNVPIVGTLNTFLGGCVGAVEGVLYLYLAVTTVSLVLALTGDSIPFLNRQTLESTWLIRLLLEQSALGALSAPLSMLGGTGA